MDSHRASSGTAQPSSVRDETEESGHTAEVPRTDKDGQTEESEQTAEPKTNTGWAWVVLCGAFLVYFNALGFTMSLSVYLPVWMDYFEASSATTGLVISISTLWRGILSPLASALCNRYGPRVVTMMGGLMASGGAALLSLSPSIAYLIVVNLVSAFGVSMVFVSAMQALALYFHKRYSFAVGIALAGISCGQLAYPPLITYLIDQYSWKGSILITAAINLHIVAAGALMRPVTRKKFQPETEEDQANTDQISINENASQRGHGVDIDDNAVVSGSSVVTGYRKGSTLGEGDDDEETDDTGVAIIIADDATNTAEFINDCSAHPVEEITGTFVAAIEEDGLAQVSDLDSVISNKKPNTTIGFACLGFSQLKHFVLDTYGLRRLVHNFRFMLMLVVYFFHGFGKFSITYIVARAESVGIDLDQSALLLSMLGIGGLIGRIGPGWFIDKRYISADMAYLLGLAVFCASVSLVPAFVVFGPLGILSVVIGASSGVSGSLSLVVIRSLVQPSDATAALGVMLVFMACGTLSGILVAGLIYDNTESYDVAFFTGGAILLVAGLLATVGYCLKKAHKKRHLPKARFWAKLPRNISLKKMPNLNSDQPSSKLSGSHNADLGTVNPPVNICPSSEMLGNDTMTHSQSTKEVVGHQLKKKALFRRKPRSNSYQNGFFNPLSGSLAIAAIEGGTAEAAGTKYTQSTGSLVAESDKDCQQNGIDLTISCSADQATSNAPKYASHCVNQQTHDSAPQSAECTLDMDCCNEDATNEGGFENPAFAADPTSTAWQNDKESTKDISLTMTQPDTDLDLNRNSGDD